MVTRRERKKRRRHLRRLDRSIQIFDIDAPARPLNIKWVGHYEEVRFYTSDGLIKRGDHRYWMARGRKLAARDYQEFNGGKDGGDTEAHE